jgi:polyvinyl alcohol dehydrogenase (cytochrome)
VLRNAEHHPLGRAGEYLFDQHCADCHDNPAMNAPTRQALSMLAKEDLMIALEFGKMQPMAAHLSKQQRGLIAYYLAGSASGQYDWLSSAMCDSAPERSRSVRSPASNCQLLSRRHRPCRALWRSNCTPRMPGG